MQIRVFNQLLHLIKIHLSDYSSLQNRWISWAESETWYMSTKPVVTIADALAIVHLVNGFCWLAALSQVKTDAKKYQSVKLGDRLWAWSEKKSDCSHLPIVHLVNGFCWLAALSQVTSDAKKKTQSVLNWVTDLATWTPTACDISTFAVL